MKKRLSIMLSFLTVIILLTACGSNAGKSGSNGNPNTGSGATALTLWTVDDHHWIDGAIEEFNKEHDDIKVKVSKYSVDTFKETLKIAANSNSMPNMWFTWGGSLGGFYAENGLTADLTTLAKDKNWSEKYNQAALELSTYNGKVSGFPYHLNSVDLWYSKAIMDELKLTPPQTFEEFEALLPQIQKGGYTPLAFGGKHGWHLMRLLEQLIEHYGGPTVHDQLISLETPWSNEAVVKAFEKIKEYADKEYFPKGFIAMDQTEIVNNYFYPNKAAFNIEGTWLDSSISAAEFNNTDYAVSKFPTGRSSVFAGILQVKNGMSNEELEATIVLGEYLTSSETVNKYLDSYGTPATLNVAFTDKTPNVQPLLDMAGKGSFLILDQALPQEVINKVFEAQDKVVFGEWAPEQAGEEIEKAVLAYKNNNQ